MTALVRGGILSTALLATLLTAGCASADTPRSHAGKDSPSQEPLPTLAGQETFFDGRIIAEVKVGAMTGFTRSPEGEGGGEPGGHHRAHGNFSMGGMGGGVGGGGGGGGGRHRGEGDRSDGDVPGPDSATPEQARLRTARRADQMGAPPVMIHLRFTNTGSDRVDLVIADFLSPLGNFVVTPEKLSLDPGQAVEVEPMISRLAGEITGGEIRLNLRLGSRQETKTVTLQPEAKPVAPALAPPA